MCLSAGVVAAESAQAEAVAEILEAHERASSLAGLYALSPTDPAHAAAAAAAAQPEQPQANGAAGHGEEEEEDGPAEEAPDAVDWDAPLRPPAGEDKESGGKAAAAAEGSQQAAAGAGGDSSAALDPAEQRRLVQVAELGLRFAEAAADSNHLGETLASPVFASRLPGWRHFCASLSPCGVPVRTSTVATDPSSWPACLPADAARSALGVLVRYSPVLPPALLEELVFRMGQCAMTESARNLARAVAAAPARGSTGALQVRQGWAGHFPGILMRL